MRERAKRFSVNGHVVREGEFVSFDGLTGEVKLAKAASRPSEILQVLAGQRFPEVLGFQKDTVQHTFVVPPASAAV